MESFGNLSEWYSVMSGEPSSDLRSGIAATVSFEQHLRPPVP